MQGKAIGMIAALTILCGPAYALDNLTTQAIRDAVQLRQRVVAANNLRSITAYYLGEFGGCSNISLETSERRGRMAYRVCGDTIQERSELAPAAPYDPNYRRIVVTTGPCLTDHPSGVSKTIWCKPGAQDGWTETDVE